MIRTRWSVLASRRTYDAEMDQLLRRNLWEQREHWKAKACATGQRTADGRHSRALVSYARPRVTDSSPNVRSLNGLARAPERQSDRRARADARTHAAGHAA